MNVFDLRDPCWIPWAWSVTFVEGDTGNPDDVFAAREERQAVALGLLYLAIDQQILDSTACIPAQGADAIPRPAIANRKAAPVFFGESQSDPARGDFKLPRDFRPSNQAETQGKLFEQELPG
jgi:hypothetical protein